MALLRLDDAGQLDLERFLPSATQDQVFCNEVALDSRGFVVAAGYHSDAQTNWNTPLLGGIEVGALVMDSSALQVPVPQLNSAVADIDLAVVPLVWLEDTGAGDDDAFVSRLVLD
jgi:hypothetical protein